MHLPFGAFVLETFLWKIRRNIFFQNKLSEVVPLFEQIFEKHKMLRAMLILSINLVYHKKKLMKHYIGLSY